MGVQFISPQKTVAGREDRTRDRPHTRRPSYRATVWPNIIYISKCLVSVPAFIWYIRRYNKNILQRTKIRGHPSYSLHNILKYLNIYYTQKKKKKKKKTQLIIFNELLLIYWPGKKPLIETQTLKSSQHTGTKLFLCLLPVPFSWLCFF